MTELVESENSALDPSPSPMIQASFEESSEEGPGDESKEDSEGEKFVLPDLSEYMEEENLPFGDDYALYVEEMQELYPDVDFYHVKEGTRQALVDNMLDIQCGVLKEEAYSFRGLKDGVFIMEWANPEISPNAFAPYKAYPENPKELSVPTFLVESISRPGFYVFDLGEAMEGYLILRYRVKGELVDPVYTYCEKEDFYELYGYDESVFDEQ
ncbi:MAG: hypothetical protein K6F84_08305 [Lachnospiraceae bacterium]|nr:hypothetical protein [Lachnospiraceae bacterium]